jgi:protein-histidine N-methyltransferase
VTLEDGRPNGEFLLATGSLPGEDVAPAAGRGGGRASSPAAAAVAAARVDNPSDCLLFPATLLAADRLYAQKAEILAAAGLEPQGQVFPVRRDALPTQLLSYLRLARVQDPAQFARVSFDADVVVSQMNEYEVLQLLMGDCRERLSAYEGGTLEEECKLLQGQSQEMMAAASGKGKGGAVAAGGDAEQQRRALERLAARLRASEKAVLSATTDAVRRRLAPIRGIPTKSGGMQDPNADLREIFEALEGIPSAPARALDTVRRWAKGEFDPDWKK